MQILHIKMFAASMPKKFVEPQVDDVLCGRGGVRMFKHPGNQMLRALTVLKLDEYVACQKKCEKTTIIRYVIRAIFSTGGRFLKYDSDAEAWYDGGLHSAKSRVGVAFRDAKSPNKMQYVRDMQEELINIRNQRSEEAVRNDPVQPDSVEASSRSSSSDRARHQVISSADPMNCQSDNIQSTQPDIPLLLVSVPTSSRIVASSLRNIGAEDEAEPCPLDIDNEDIDVATASYLLDTLSCVADDLSYSSLSEEESLTGVCKDDFLVKIELVTSSSDQQYDSDESSCLTDLPCSNELFQ